MLQIAEEGSAPTRLRYLCAGAPVRAQSLEEKMEVEYYDGTGQ